MVSVDSSALVRQVVENLEQLQQQLLMAQAGVSITIQFLKTQDAEQDWDVACVLEHCVGSCLREQIVRIEELVYALESRCAEVVVESGEEPPRPLQ